ncbi:MAG: hypothetical protein HY711_00850 [Candidatus Melainabacteria bacterium]|nr:hypothetical protein [Candidatus Melainabacteria bacterium]
MEPHKDTTPIQDSQTPKIDRNPSLDLVELTRQPASASPDARHVETKPKSIGVAYMDQDGTITLQLRAEGAGAIGDAILTYQKSDKDYAKILLHIGGLKPGGYKPVPPWPENSKEKSEKKDSIGVATMDSDGTITLQLRAEKHDAVGDALLVYHKSHKDYAKILSHIGNLKPGQSLPVPPWTQEGDKK